ncbi:hypothetical protein ACFV00_25195 [Streptomyces californicus]|uniref:hypothetical protein n=1 Tax=Streptomyces californicus TaxID=67351 RepID=UPI0036B4C9D6
MSHTYGHWPINNPVDLDETKQQGAQHLQLVKERARCLIVRDSIRAHLAEQPSPRAVRLVQRLYNDDIDRMAADAITALTSTETHPVSRSRTPRARNGATPGGAA